VTYATINYRITEVSVHANMNCADVTSGLTATNMGIAVFWNATLYTLVITLMMETVRSSESSVSIYQTIWWYIPEDSHR
jgi:hypothetical protein